MAVRAAVAKSRQAARERAAARAARKAEQEDKVKKAKAAEEAEFRRRNARVELGRAIHAGDDSRAAEAAALVDIELLALADREGSTPLHGAASRGLIECCSKILKRRDLRPEMLQVRDARGWTPLHCAAAAGSGSPEICSLLVDHPACPLGAHDVQGRTALDVAREWGLAEPSEVLLHAIQPDLGRTSSPKISSRSSKSPSGSPAGKKKASPKSSPKTSRKSSPKTAKSNPKKQIVEEAQPDTLEGDEVSESESQSAEELDWTAKSGIHALADGRLEDVLSILGKPGWPFVNEADDHGRTLLHLGALRGIEELCTAVLDRDDFESADKFDNDRATALHLAAANRHVNACIAIVGSGRFSAVNAQDMRDQTPLHLAAVRGDEDCYNAILAHEDCDPHIRDYKRRSAPDYAVERGIDAEGQDPLDDRGLQIDL